ncbi:flavodoxin family protein [Paramaledivibacter caminithermalis]|uniref:Flavodoxin n=1 Tax=Paramaledivibacter caminithermalis (strain DSM 15212 / CIP 107654 / DViRD3) TaxID=1121301 RepID=A0A1M6RIW5_PARC5|nr:flavodoxin [Paramaledivibacter caminithermalis]SHK32297.1 Flavodoxin [Paramaledivibacter caminithermalis DSM 15212]
MEGKKLKKLIIFYSLEGNTRFIAENISDITGGDLLELKPKEDIKSKGFMRFIWGGRQVVTGKKPELMPINKNPNDYDIIFLGTPIWASRYTPAINSFLDKTKITGKKIALFCCHAGGGNGKAFNMLKEQLKENEILGQIEFKDPLKHDKEEAILRLKKWIEEII